MTGVSLAQAQVSGIPQALVISRDGRKIQEPIGPAFALDEIAAGDTLEVTEAPPCLPGEYYVAFQLMYDLGDRSTATPWICDLSLTLLHDDDSIWTKPIRVAMEDQTFVSTIFHDSLISCDDNYRLVITQKNTGVGTPEENVYLKFLLYRKPEAAFNPATEVLLSCAYSDNSTTLDWTTSVESVQEYDLEWVYIEEHEGFTGDTGPEAFAFKEPVRVSTPATYYKHLVYYPDGELWYRIRAVGYDPAYPDHRILGQWFYSPCESITITNHQPEKTWQEQTVFAEEGKYKKIMGYYDGSMRQRQSQTNLNTEEVTLVGEALYDFEGRPSVSVLPVPALNQSLAFKPGFNVFETADTVVQNRTSEERLKFHYDNYRTVNSILSDESGAGQYYSAANGHEIIHKNYIPDAQGFVFSQTEYLNDGTGRVARQSGVGEAFRMEGDHITRYYYNSAAAEELIRLFGSNVGKASHYKKNMVVDPNGQVSISYLDQEDRVIATALAGEKPGNVAALPSYPDDPGTITVDITDKNVIQDGARTLGHKISNVSPNTSYAFRYDLSALASSADSIGCISCRFDLTITITDPEGSLVELPEIDGNESPDRFSYTRDISADSCGERKDVLVEFDVLLEEIGDYTVTKVLKAHELSFEEIKTIVLTDTTYSTKVEEIRSSYVVDSDDCEICSQECPEADSIVNNVINEIAVQDCDNIYRQIVQYYQDLYPDSVDYEPTRGELEEHELWCKYELCTKNIDSDVFDKQMVRVDGWNAAVAARYHQVDSLVLYWDPFFSAPLSGAGEGSSMLSMLNDITLLPGMSGTILEVTDPDNPDFFVDDDGNQDPDGKHVLYMDLISDKDEMTPAEYDQEEDQQRWVLYKSFYMEAKRQIKLAKYEGCPAALEDLQATDDMIALDTEEEIEEWAEENGMDTDSVSEEEVAMSYYSIKFNCDADISPADSTSIAGHLEAYFNGNSRNFFRLILISDLTTNPELQAIKDILDDYGCGLDSVAVDDPISCVKDTTITISSSGGSSSIAMRMGSTDTDIAQSSGVSTSDTYDNIEIEILKSSRNKKDSIQGAIKAQIWDAKNRNVSNARSGSVQLLSASPPSQPEYDALLALYDATDGSNWQYDNNWTSVAGSAVPVGDWYGITVDLAGHIIKIDLRSNHLIGYIPEEIGDLIYLEELSLGRDPSDIVANENLLDQGGLPSSIGDLVNLISLDLNTCKIPGSIPTEITNLTHLQLLDLSINEFTGAIPSGFDNLDDLTFLSMRENINLTGDFDVILNELPLDKLVTLDLYHNQITGYIPSSIGDFDSLKILDLSANQIGGNIPSTIGDLARIQLLGLYNNDLTGEIPSSIGQLQHLMELTIAYNPLTSGGIPSLNAATNLQFLWLDACNRSGSLKQLLNNLPLSVQTLLLLDNQLQGSIPDSIQYFTNLTVLNLGGNELTGSIPAVIGQLDQLQSLGLDDNELTGSIPSEIGELINVYTISLTGNQLTGSIPPELGALLNLTAVGLSGNKLTGSLPIELRNGRGTYYLNDNLLSGYIPPEISESTINFLTIEHNRFTFEDILDFKRAYGTRDFNYLDQAEVDVEKNIAFTVGSTLRLEASVDRNTSPKSKYQWFKDNVAVTSIDTAYHTYIVLNATEADSGDYYYQITNADASNLILKSNLQHVQVQEDTSQTICLEYDTTNATLDRFKYIINWSKIVEKCLADAAEEDTILIEYAIEKLIEQEATDFYFSYVTNCLANAEDSLLYTYPSREHHYTLYYYDQAGNLVQTVPPNGVDILSSAEVKKIMLGITTANPAHTMITRYQYGSLNQLLWQKTPDAGESNFWYNDKAQLRLSQNAQQLKDRHYSYVKYDELSRLIEAGEMLTEADVNVLIDSLASSSFPVNDEAYQLSDVSRTHYDLGRSSIQEDFAQSNLRTRVAWIEVIEKDRTDTLATYYSYDIHGNVRSLLQHIPGLSDKRTDYVYDLISGKVNYVLYQYGAHNQFIHQYTYDADNRITDVHTSTDGYLWDHDARYFYYLHGPLARVELGEYRVQGLDYYYTLQGWIKGVNMPYEDDPGNDGFSSSTVGRDVFAFTLGYYQDDYQTIGNSIPLSDTRDQLWTRYDESMDNSGLFNGNISWMVTDLKKIGQQNGARAKGMQAMLYQYDQLHRIVQGRSLTSYTAGTGFAARTTAPSPYDENYTYDPNGNILTLNRRDDQAGVLNDFHYDYYTGTNKLKYLDPVVRDTVYRGAVISNNKVYRNITVDSTSYVPAGRNVELRATNNIYITDDFDVEDDADFHGYVLTDEEGAYVYDAIGNLIWDQEQGVKIQWTPSGKVRQVTTKGDSTVVTFRYDGMGNRVEKKVVKIDTAYVTRYVRDGSGNVMAIYNDTLLTEQAFYGSARLGMYRGHRALAQRRLGAKQYELSNHLGNVIGVITDNVGISADSAWALVINANDYYPFGLEMKGRVYSDSTYRYGFNGQEKVDEIGTSHYTALYWEYDSKIGRRWNRDPVVKSWQSDYACFSNNPIMRIDPLGDDDIFDADGNFLYSTKTGTLIKISVGGKVQALSQVVFMTIKVKDEKTGNVKVIGTGASNKVISKIISRYHKSTSEFIVQQEGEGEEGYAAWEPSTNNILMALDKSNHTKQLLNDYNNLKSALVHEERHKTDNKAKISDLEHINVYMAQFKDKSFTATTSEFKKEMFRNVDQFIIQINVENYGDPEIYNEETERIQSEIDRLRKEYNIPASE